MMRRVFLFTYFLKFRCELACEIIFKSNTQFRNVIFLAKFTDLVKGYELQIGAH